MSKIIYFIPFLIFTTHLLTLGLLPFKEYDEIYYADFANDYIGGKLGFDVHPPTGKLLIALSISLFKNNPFGWRMADVLFGIMLIVFSASLAKKVFGGKHIFNLVLILLSFESLTFVLSHFALLDVFGATFVVMSFWFSFKYLEQEKLFFLYSAFALLGLAVSVKWSNLIFLVPILVLLIKRGKLKILDKRSLVFLSILLLTYLATFGPNILLGDNIINWHKSALEYHLNFKDVHRYHSPWWTWWFDYRPTWLKFDRAQGLMSGVVAIGNPIIFWGIVLSMILTTFYLFKKTFLNLNIKIMYLSVLLFSLQWLFLNRSSFNYNVLPAVPFGVIVLSCWLSNLWEKKGGSTMVLSCLALTGLTFIFFLPLLVGWPVGEKFFFRHIWFSSWV